MSRLNINYYLTEVKEHYYIYISVVWQRQRIRKPLNFIIDKKKYGIRRNKDLSHHICFHLK